ncbi:hypothetical protein QFC24_000518 [Naganishia onofrii]|uniref:Uncharacterized protein n=1 Tax=Naganishia onofrii TaxID=1851511 RepID=A0ACC2XX13_9TREE|nr:hypothetical protein QFC24_000518 [Naganishia onofrii]
MSVAVALPPPLETPLGCSIPPLLPHAISVSLPTWKANIGYEEGEKWVVEKMQTGYPRFFIHRSIQKLARICLAKFGTPEEHCTLFPSPKVAQEARKFLQNRLEPVASRIVEFVICPSSSSLITPATEHIVGSPGDTAAQAPAKGEVDVIELQILLYNKQAAPLAKQFWQHTGDGVSSRLAERALAFLGEGPASPADETGDQPVTNFTNGVQTENEDASPATDKQPLKLSYSRNRHYGGRGKVASLTTPVVSRTPSLAGNIRTSLDHKTPSPTSSALPISALPEDEIEIDHSTFLEERYGRNLPLSSSKLAKTALRRRIAGVLLPEEKAASSGAGAEDQVPRGIGGGLQGGKHVKPLTEDEVYLYPTGMSAIWHSHQLAMYWKTKKQVPVGKSICFGFPYTDTLKILQKWGPGCHFFGHGDEADLDAFAQLLEEQRSQNSGEPPILSLFCEFPSNPLLRSPNLKRLRELADEYGFLIIVDETVGNFVNVEVASWADIVVSSLTKVFSGDTNVMGGSLVLNPYSKHFSELKTAIEATYQDTYFAEDAVFMERNSRDFRTRIATINDNAYALTEFLRLRSLKNPSAPHGSVIKEVYYPRYITPENFSIAQRLPSTGKGGFGGLFSLTFTSIAASRAFFDALECCKGPSLGTNFTLACPYTILAHYLELDWASGFGVEAGLVRVSVGLEPIQSLFASFTRALEAAEQAQAEGGN